MMVEARLELMMVDVFLAPMGHERLIGVGHADMGISLMELQVATEGISLMELQVATAR